MSAENVIKLDSAYAVIACDGCLPCFGCLGVGAISAGLLRHSLVINVVLSSRNATLSAEVNAYMLEAAPALPKAVRGVLCVWGARPEHAGTPEN